MKRKNVFGLLALLMLVASIGAASAFRGNFFGMDPGSGNEILNAIKAKDFNAWKNAMSARLTEENFTRLVTSYEARSGMQMQREAMQQAIQAGNYEAYKEAVNQSSLRSHKNLNESDFNILVQLHQAKIEGDTEKVKQLSEQLGLFDGKHKMFGRSGRGRMN